MSIKANTIQIVGMNGYHDTDNLAYGQSLPVVRRIIDNAYAVLSRGNGEQLNWHAESEAQSFSDEGKWTSFAGPLPIPLDCVDRDGMLWKQPMILYISEQFEEEFKKIREIILSRIHIETQWTTYGVPAIARVTSARSRIVCGILQMIDKRLSEEHPLYAGIYIRD